MKKIDKLSNYFVEKNQYFFETIVVILVFIIAISITMSFYNDKLWFKCLTIIVQCIAAFGTVFAVYVALNKPEPKPDVKIDVYPIATHQCCVTFINLKSQSFCYLKLKYIKKISKINGYSSCSYVAFNSIPVGLKREVVLNDYNKFKTVNIVSDTIKDIFLHNRKVHKRVFLTFESSSGTIVKEVTPKDVFLNKKQVS